ncbi:MAG: hypothetical protein FWC79_03465 [Oscillospiraceae bacterium]|nr:hypothetical protein [Oscillospiraceae bacterium]
MHDGAISNNNGAGVVINRGNFTMHDGEISENGSSGVVIDSGTYTNRSVYNEWRDNKWELC